METYSIAINPIERNHSGVNEFEEALHYRTLSYTMRHLQLTGLALQQDLQDALQKSIRVCRLAGINSKEHFKTIYVCDPSTGTIYMDIRMSRKGFSLIMMYLPLTERTASWLLQLANT